MVGIRGTPRGVKETASCDATALGANSGANQTRALGDSAGAAHRVVAREYAHVASLAKTYVAAGHDGGSGGGGGAEFRALCRRPPTGQWNAVCPNGRV